MGAGARSPGSARAVMELLALIPSSSSQSSAIHSTSINSLKRRPDRFPPLEEDGGGVNCDGEMG